MSNGSKKITQLPVTNQFSNTDLLIIVQNTGATAQTNSITPGVLLAGFAYQANLVNLISNSITVGNSSANVFLGFNSTDSSLTEFGGSANNYLQVLIYNSNTGNNASADLSIYDTVGPTTNNFIDIGINGNNYNQTTWTINGPSDGYVYTGNTNLSIGTQGSNFLNFFTGNTLAANERMRISANGNIGIGTISPIYKLQVTGTIFSNTVIAVGSNVSFATNQISIGNTVALTANGANGSSGQVLTSNGSTIYWTNPTGLLTNLTAQTTGFTATGGYRYRLNSTGGAFSVTLPTSPADGTLVSFILSAGTNTITFIGGTVLGGASTLSVTGSFVNLQYNATTGNWEQI